MKRGVKSLSVVALLIFAASMFASEADAGKSWKLHLYHPTHIGTAVLQSGDYTVQQVKDGEQQVLVFKSGKNEVARATCSTEQLRQKPITTSVMETKNDAGDYVLRGISFAGDQYKHNLAESVAQVR